MCKYVDNLSFLRQTLNKIVLLIILTWSGVRSLSKILQKKKASTPTFLSSAQETRKESSLGQRVKNHGNGWLTSTKRQVSTEEKTLWGRVLMVTTVTFFFCARVYTLTYIVHARRKQIAYKICRLFYRQTRHFAKFTSALKYTTRKGQFV